MPSLTPRLDQTNKNYIINGNFDYWQRATSFSANGYTSDRFQAIVTTGTMVVTRSTDVPDANSEFSLQIAATTATLPDVRQKMESLFARNLANQTVTFKIKYKVTDSTLVPLKAVFSTANVKDNFSAITEFSTLTINATPLAASGWQTYIVSLVVPAGAFNGLQIRLVRDNGAVSATTTTLYSQVQILLGTNADPDFSYSARNSVEELQLCQRYYYKNVDTAEGAIALDSEISYLFATNAALGPAVSTTITYLVEMRSIPTIALWVRNTGVYGSWHFSVVGVSELTLATTAVNVNRKSFRVQSTATVAAVQNACYGPYSANAEL